MADWIEEGKKAPAFTLTADDGTKVKLSELKGKPVVLYFYPRDDTPGCTREACAFRDRKQEMDKLGAVAERDGGLHAGEQEALALRLRRRAERHRVEVGHRLRPGEGVVRAGPRLRGAGVAPGAGFRAHVGGRLLSHHRRGGDEQGAEEVHEVTHQDLARMFGAARHAPGFRGGRAPRSATSRRTSG